MLLTYFKIYAIVLISSGILGLLCKIIDKIPFDKIYFKKKEKQIKFNKNIWRKVWKNLKKH